MFKKILKSFALVAILALVALSGSVVLAQTIPATPGICTVAEMGTIPGCNPPINTGFTAQIKDGSLGILGILSLISGRHLDTAQDLGSSTDSTLRADYAGLIGYLTGYKLDWDGISIPPAITNTSPARHALVIYGGAGADNEGYRLVKLWDNLDVVGTTTASNMDVHNNVYAKNFYTCPTPGSCSIINPGGGYWTKSGVNLYATTLTDNVGIGDDTPSYKLDVAGTVRATSDFRVDAGSGSANATLNLVGRYSGTAYPASTFANMLGGLSINPNAAAPVVGIRLNPTTGATLQVGGNQAIGYANNTAAPTNGLAVNGEVGITSLVDLGFSKTPDVDRETNAGKIAYQKWSTGLDIVGAGPKNSSDRLVKLWDNVTIPGDLNVDGTTTLNNLVVNNVCTADGSCSTGGLGNWTKNGNNIYNNNSANVGIGIANPSHTLHVVNKETGDSAN